MELTYPLILQFIIMTCIIFFIRHGFSSFLISASAAVEVQYFQQNLGQKNTKQQMEKLLALY